MGRVWLLGIIILFGGLSGCRFSQEKKLHEKSTNLYARGFELTKKGVVTELTVFNPWEKARNISQKYYLVPREAAVPDSLPEEKVIRTPVKRMICMSTSHLGFIRVLDEIQTVVGISGSSYVTDSVIRRQIENGHTVDVGYGQVINYELILKQHPDVVMAYGVGGEVSEYLQKLEDLGIHVVMNAEYLEENPLGKAEWLKFMAVFFGKEIQALEFFDRVEKNYLEIKNRAVHQRQKPRVMVGSPYRDSWWVPGGNSYMANLIADAGGEYLGRSNPGHESFVISFEHALSWGNKADVWINMGNLASKKEILSTDNRFDQFRVFHEGRIFNNNKRLSETGGNDFWESGTVRPDRVLGDLTQIFHPGVSEGEMYYYKEIR